MALLGFLQVLDREIFEIMEEGERSSGVGVATGSFVQYHAKFGQDRE
jgi:hypothetical protein